MNFFGGRFLNDGIGAVGFTSVRAIPWRGSREAMCVRFGPGPGVAVVADLVARHAARLGDHLLAGFVFGERLAAGLQRPPWASAISIAVGEPALAPS